MQNSDQTSNMYKLQKEKEKEKEKEGRCSSKKVVKKESHFATK